MGWIYTRKPAAVGDFLRSFYEGETETAKRTVLRGAFVGLTYYCAVEYIEKATGARRVYAGVALVRYTRDGDIGVKDMDETVGPCVNRCPGSILAMLTEPEPGYAPEWRARCAAWNEARRAIAAGKKKMANPGYNR